jgi:DnaJ-class molecular chaperone
MTKTMLCPRCKGVGLIETAIGGRFCYECHGKGRLAVSRENGPGKDRRAGQIDQAAPAHGSCTQGQGG